MLKLVYRSTTPAVSLTEMKAHLRREDTDEDDTLIERYTQAATQYVENWTGLCLVDTTWDYFFSYPDGEDPYGRFVTIPKGPLIDVEGVFYRDTAEGEFSGYTVSYVDPPSRSRIYLSATGSWPTTDTAILPGRIRFRAGFVDQSSPSDLSANEVPEDIKAAIQLYVGSLYDRREETTQGSKAPWGCEQLLRMWRVDNSMA